jgi:putative sterol carrier protein
MSDKQVLEVKVLLFSMLNGLEEISKVDENFREDLEGYEGKIQWKLGENINAYQVFEGGKYSWKIDAEIEDPDVTLKIPDLKVAKGILLGEIDSTSAYMSGDTIIEGNLQVVMELGSLTEYLLDYLQPLSPK